MAYDETVANRLRAALARALRPTDEIEERKMFGGLAELVNGHMCIGVLGVELILHVRDEEAAGLLALPHTRPMDFTGRPMRGWLYVSAEGYRKESDLDAWVGRALDFVHVAGPKESGSPRPKAVAPRAKEPSPKRPNQRPPKKGA